MPPIIHGVVSWPGVIAVEGFDGTISHGPSPNTLILRTSPQPNFPAMFGNLVITDQVNTVVLKGCRVKDVKVIQEDERGYGWQLWIEDRRWRWQENGFLFGCYNQLLPNGDLIPYTIRSPSELAILCLTALGETVYTIDLPIGLSDPGLVVPTGLGGITAGGVNPPINWEGIPPAQALAQLCDQFNRRIVYDPISDSVLIVQPGVGTGLVGNWSIHRQGPSFAAPKVPSGVGVIGAPTRYQCRLAVEAVGKEYDGWYYPIDMLSYAPDPLPPAKQVTTITLGGTPDAQAHWKITISYSKTVVGGFEKTFTANFDVGSTGNFATDCTDIAAQINANATVNTILKAVAGASTVTLTGLANGQSFDVSVEMTVTVPKNPSPSISQTLTTLASDGASRWAYSNPPLFPNVKATDQVTYDMAVQLAQESVFRCYRITCQDLRTPGQPAMIPGFGRVPLRQLIILQDTQVDQNTPQPVPTIPEIDPDGDIDPAGVTINGRPFVADFYAGYAHDLPAFVFGAISAQQQLGDTGIAWSQQGSDPNTKPSSRIFVPFDVDPQEQLIRFHSPVYFQDVGGKIKEPKLTLQTAVLVRNPDTLQIERFTSIEPLAQGDALTPPAMEIHPDIELEITSRYDTTNNLVAFTVLDQDPLARAKFYLDGLIAKYTLSGGLGQTFEINGIAPFALDGLRQQITWHIGEDGCSTTLSLNSEHNLYVDKYPARRRIDHLQGLVRGKVEDGRVKMWRGGFGWEDE